MSKIRCIDIRTIVVIFLSFFAFFLGMVEAYYSSHYKEYNNQCDYVWALITTSSVINIFIPICTCCGLSIIIGGNSEKNKNIVLEFAQIGQFIIAIWSTVIYFSIDNNCYNFWISQAYEIWTLVIIHFVMLWIMIISTFLTVIIYYLLSQYKKHTRKNQIKEVTNQFEMAAKLASEEIAISNI